MLGLASATFGAVAALLAGCAFNPDKKSGSDATRPDATPVEFSKPVSDSISYEEQDRSDWKSFELAAPGAVTLNVRWDYRRCDCEMLIFGALGERVGRLPNRGKKYGEELVLKDLPAGKYYVQFIAKGEDDYSDYFFTAKMGTPEDELLAKEEARKASLIKASVPPPTAGGAVPIKPSAPPPVGSAPPPAPGSPPAPGAPPPAPGSPPPGVPPSSPPPPK
jgi:hypothetical protein